jgi:hypothetical protein
MQYYCAAAGSPDTVFSSSQLDNSVIDNNGRSVTEGEVGVHKIKGESENSGEVRAVSSVSDLHAFCKPDFSNRPRLHGCVVQVHSFSGSFRSTVQYHFLSVGRFSDSLRAGRSGDRNPADAKFSALVQHDPGAPLSLLYRECRVFPGSKTAVAWR